MSAATLAPDKSASKTVLVVEDDADMREAARDSIQADGFRTVTAGNGAEAVDLLERGQIPDAVVLDLMMPVMNGWDFLSWMAERPALNEVPVIVMSASRECERARELHSGVIYCLSKPFRLDTLLWALGRVTSRDAG